MEHPQFIFIVFHSLMTQFKICIVYTITNIVPIQKWNSYKVEL